MRVAIVAIGRAKAGPELSLFEHYRGRMRWAVTLRELDVRAPDAQRRGREAETLLAAIPSGAKVVALDERGTMPGSEAFAATLGQWRDGGDADIAFLIGGADGFDDSVRRRADLVLALGRLTWPHMLVRALLMEQLYRAQQILAGHPYHRV